MTLPEAALVDTNILVDATDVRRPRHRAALALLEEGAPLVTCAQVAREYLVVSTRPTSANGLGLTGHDALMNLAELRTILRLLPEEVPVLPRLIELLTEVPCTGRVIHDAALVACMLAHGVDTLVTANPKDFVRFGDRLRLVALPE